MSEVVDTATLICAGATYPKNYPCIYRLYTPAGHHYIGSTKDINQRIKKHETRLRKQQHSNHKVQLAYNTYGLYWEVLHPVSSPARLQFVEQQYLTKYSSCDKSLNISQYAQYNPHYNGKGRPVGCAGHGHKETTVVDTLTNTTAIFHSQKAAKDYLCKLLNQKYISINKNGYIIKDRFYVLCDNITKKPRPLKKQTNKWFDSSNLSKNDRISIGRTDRIVVSLTNIVTGVTTKFQSIKRASRFVYNETGIKVQLYKYVNKGVYRHYKITKHGV